jgi:Rrf2 family protein
MKITAQEEYAIRCLGHLARSETKTTISQIAEVVGLSDENTAKIMARLRQLGLVQSLRGKEGGYLLARPAEEISVAEVLEGISGGVFETERCVTANEGRGCNFHEDCGIRPVWVSLGGLVHDFLGSVSLADILANERDVRAQVTDIAAGVDQSRLLRRAPAREALRHSPNSTEHA